MSAESDQEKTEDPTPQKREDFRKQGQVVQTRELASALSLFGFAFIIYFMGRLFIEQFYGIYSQLYAKDIVIAVKTGDIMPSLVYAFKKIFFLTLPIYVIMFVFGMASSMVQVGVLFTSETLTPNLKKINPLSGLKRMFSMKSLVEGIKAIFKFSIVGFVIYMVFRGEVKVIPKLMFSEASQVLYYIGTLAFTAITSIGGVMLVLAGLDYLFQRYDMENQMKMTKQEVKEESKSREGDPLIKARIRKIQKEMSSKRMMADVPKADVIITNPTHLSIALKYDPEKFAAPIILAMGADNMAKKIREMAKELEIPIVENKPLARTIYKTLEVGQTIPRELFAAVAEVLAYVFKLRRKKKAHG